MQCNGIQGLSARLTRGVHLPYISSVTVYKASVIN